MRSKAGVAVTVALVRVTAAAVAAVPVVDELRSFIMVHSPTYPLLIILMALEAQKEWVQVSGSMA